MKNIFRISLLLIGLLTMTNGTVEAQLMEEKDKFTRADSLRGTLSELRSWFDVHYYDLHVQVFVDEKYIEGYNKIYYKVLEESDVMQIDLFDNLQVNSILYKGEKLKYKREHNAIFIELGETAEVGSLQSLTISYEGQPQIAKNAPWDGGFVWEKDEEGKDWVGVACQGLGASVWWPNKDHQSEEPDSMLITCTVPKGLTCIANGNMRSQREDFDNSIFEWFVSYPINNYNVSLNIGDYTHFSEVFEGADGRKLDLDYYVLSYNLETAKEHFKQVKPMMACFEEALGPYPFWEDGFALVETPYLGMEHQSAIAYGNKYLTGYAGMDYSRIGLDFDYIIIHEAGHEWWGNSITSYDIADMWIHEGFCTYSESLYVECLYGYDKALEYINAKKPSIRNERPIIGPYNVNKEGSGDMYSKGMLFLNTVRHIVDNEEVWKEGIIKGLLKDFENTIVNTDTIVQYINRKSGKKLDRVFDQYLKHPNIPVLKYKLDSKGKMLSYKWDADVEGFDMPVKYIDRKGNSVWLNPTTEWQDTKVKMKKTKKVKFEEDLFYIKVMKDK